MIAFRVLALKAISTRSPRKGTRPIRKSMITLNIICACTLDGRFAFEAVRITINESSTSDVSKGYRFNRGGGGGDSTVEDIADHRNNCDKRAPSNLHATEIAKCHVKPIGPSLDFDQRLLIFARKPRGKSFLASLSLLVTCSRKAASRDGFKVGIVFPLIIFGALAKDFVED